MKIILQKLIASAGNYSRRQAEDLIRLGKVRVNGEEAFLGQKADFSEDKIEVNNRVIKLAEDLIYIKLNKPRGYVSTTAKFLNEQSIFELVNVKKKLFPVGRLDKNSRGLMLLTNDGALAQKLSHPKFEHEKVYEVRVKFTEDINLKPNYIVNELKKGVDIGEGDGVVKAKRIQYLNNNIFEIVLAEGKKRQLRRMFEALGYKVSDLKRVSISKLTLGDLKEGKWSYLSDKELNLLKT